MCNELYDVMKTKEKKVLASYLEEKGVQLIIVIHS